MDTVARVCEYLNEVNALTNTFEQNATDIALSLFAQRLNDANVIFSSPERRNGIILALGATIEFVRSIPVLAMYVGPFVKLCQAVNDIDDGIMPDLFHMNRPPGRPHSSDSKALAGMAACALQVLIEQKYRKQDSAARIARKLCATGVAIGNKNTNLDITATAQTICYWRDRARKGNRDFDDDARTYYSCLIELRPCIQPMIDAGGTKDIICERLLDAFINTCKMMGLVGTKDRVNPPV